MFKQLSDQTTWAAWTPWVFFDINNVWFWDKFHNFKRILLELKIILVSMGHSNYGFQNTHTTDMQEFIWKKAPVFHMKHWWIMNQRCFHLEIIMFYQLKSMTIEKNDSFVGQNRETEAENSEIKTTNKLSVLLSLASSSTIQEYQKS